MKTTFVKTNDIKHLKTPFHIYDEKGIRENARKLNKAFSWNKGFKEYFAIKATPNPIILKILHEESCGMDASSLAELVMCERLNIKDIMFSSNETPIEEYEKAAELGAIINLDDITHIEYIKNKINIPKKMCVRYNPGGVFKMGTSIMDNPGDAKYGMTKQQLIDAIIELKELGVESFGIHSFLASNTKTNDYYPTLAKILFELVNEVEDKTGIKIDFINLSGGIGVPYLPEEEPCDIDYIGKKVKEAYDEVLRHDVQIFTELGRFMLAPYGALVTRAIHEKHTYKDYIGVDSCSVDLMRPAMYGAYHHITILGKENAPLTQKYDIVGSLCENNDKFAIDRVLPQIDKNDILVIHDTGAHGQAMGYNYNGKLKCAEYLLKTDGTTKLIRRSETLEDYFATMIWSD